MGITPGIAATATRAWFTAGPPALTGETRAACAAGGCRTGEPSRCRSCNEHAAQFQHEAKMAFRRMGLQMPLGFSSGHPGCMAEVLQVLQAESQQASTVT